MEQLVYELSIYKFDDVSFRNELLYLIKDIIKEDKVIVVAGTIDNYHGICIGTNITKIEYLKAIILNEISKFSAIYYKRKFLFSQIHIGISEYYYNQLIHSLVIFDLDTDIKIIKEELNKIIDDKCIYIDSLFSFRLKELYDRWKDIGRIIGDNIAFMLNEKSVEEIIAEFIGSSSHNAKQLNICIKNNVIQLSKNGCDFLEEFANNIEGQEKLLCKIITFYPEKIKLDGNTIDIENFKRKLISVFKNKVVIIS